MGTATIFSPTLLVYSGLFEPAYKPTFPWLFKDEVSNLCVPSAITIFTSGPSKPTACKNILIPPY